MRGLPVACGLLLLLVAAAQAAPGATVALKGPVDAEADLHGLCESLLRACDGLDPSGFGMTPVDAMLPDDATWDALAVHEKVHLDARPVAKEKAKVGVDAGWDGGDSGSGSGSTATSGSTSSGEQVPCADAPHCPDLIVDAAAMVLSVRMDVRTFAADHCAVDEGSTVPGERTLLRFDFVSPNVGVGDLEVGHPLDHPEWFEWGACHGHWHFAEYADYRLWDLPGYAAWQALRAAHPTTPPGDLLETYPELRDHLVAGHKQGFCVLDLIPWSPVAGNVHPRQFRSCADDQGITAGWADKYSLFLDGQWIDVTGLPAGAYVLEAEVNPERLYIESDYADNSAAVVVAIA